LSSLHIGHRFLIGFVHEAWNVIGAVLRLSKRHEGASLIPRLTQVSMQELGMLGRVVVIRIRTPSRQARCSEMD
jgi:hypothetical protein